MRLANKPSKKKSLRLYICDFVNYLTLKQYAEYKSNYKMISPTSHWSFRLEILHQIGEVLNFGIDHKRFRSINTTYSII